MLRLLHRSPRAALLLGGSLLFAAADVARGSDFATRIQPLLQQHCVQCHGQDGKVKGRVNLLEIDSAEALHGDPDLLSDVLDAIRYQEMPPEDEPQLESDTRESLVAALEAELQAALSQDSSFAHTPIRRMTRFQYANAVEDLFELDRLVFSLPERMMREYGNYFDPASGRMPDVVKVGNRPLGKSQMIERRLAGVSPFPQDLRAEHGYDTQADHLSLSPLLFESFLKLSRSIVESPDFHQSSSGIWDAFFAEPEGGVDLKATLRARLTPFLTRAFRRQATDEEVDRYLAFAEQQLARGQEFEGVMKDLAAAVIASPRFLYLYNEGTEGEPGTRPLTGLELASRLSFFLWGSLPDAKLLQLAESDALLEPEVLGAEIDRMMNDRRSKRFCDSFPTQWLQLDRIISSAPDAAVFPNFYIAKYNLSMHMALEPLLLFETVFVENRSILDLIDPDFSYRSAALEHNYGHLDQQPTRNEVTQVTFRRRSLEDRREGGVITNSAVMTMTSGSDRTHPITRGAWFGAVIFNDPPEPPPADVPPLPEHDTDQAHLTLRERLAIHREREDCAGCHEQIDPLGFALENYGPTGQWRDLYGNGREVDMSGTLFRQHDFKTVIEFKDAVLAEKERFTRALAGHLLSFAVARELDAADSPALDRITAATMADGFRLRTLMKEVLLSEPFLHKTPAPGADSSR